MMYLSYCIKTSYLDTNNISEFDILIPTLFSWKNVLNETLVDGKYSYSKKIVQSQKKSQSFDYDEVRVSFEDLVGELMEENDIHKSLNNKIYSDPEVQKFNNEGRLSEQTTEVFKKKIKNNETINIFDNKYLAAKFINLSIDYYKNGKLVKSNKFAEKYFGVFNLFEGESKNSVSFAYFILSSLHSVGLGTVLLTFMESIVKFVIKSSKDRLNKGEIKDNKFKNILLFYSQIISLEAVVNENNLPSIGVLKKVGFHEVLKGIIRGMPAVKLMKDI